MNRFFVSNSLIALVILLQVVGTHSRITGARSLKRKGCAHEDDCGKGFYCEIPSIGQCDKRGVCTESPGFCTEDYTPVCGCDGTTYSNACYAAVAGKNIASDGACVATQVVVTKPEGGSCDVNEDCDSGACYQPDECLSPPCSGICGGCNDTSDCSGLDVCVPDDINSWFSSEIKTCGCEVNTSNGCDINSDSPFCAQGYGSGVCTCGSDDDCESGKTCAQLWCLPDLVQYCATEEERASQCNY